MLRYLTAGESHGKGLTAIIEGMPAGVPIDREGIAKLLSRRQSGYGRGGRQRIEKDCVEFLSGVRGNLTLGSPITLWIKNHDYENWRGVMGDEACDFSSRAVTCPRPGHADLSGCMKYGFSDCRNVLERASARETAIRTAVGGVAMCLLGCLGIASASYVLEIGGESDGAEYPFSAICERADSSPVRALSKEAEERMIRAIDRAGAAGDTVGGKVRVVVSGLKSGIGSYAQYDRKIDAHLAFALMSIQAVKAVEVGAGCEFSKKRGSECMDEIFSENGKIYRKTNRAGGIEGGMTNGEDVVLTAVMKPIPTLKNGLSTVDIRDGSLQKAAYERSDICAVPALSVICECAACFEIAKFILSETGGNTLAEVKRAWKELP